MYENQNNTRSKQASNDTNDLNHPYLILALRKWINTIRLKYETIFYFCSENLEDDRKLRMFEETLSFLP